MDYVTAVIPAMNAGYGLEKEITVFKIVDFTRR